MSAAYECFVCIPCRLGSQSSSPSTLSEYPSAKVRGTPLTEYHVNIGLEARFVNLWQSPQGSRIRYTQT